MTLCKTPFWIVCITIGKYKLSVVLEQEKPLLESKKLFEMHSMKKECYLPVVTRNWLQR